jgi:serine protease AprX
VQEATMNAIPSYVVEYFLLGRTRREAVDRYTQDGGIVADVWLAFAAVPDAPQRVLIAPAQGVRAIDAAYGLHRCISARRSGETPSVQRATPRVSPLENFVAITLYLDELLRIALPLTGWWHDKNLNLLHDRATRSPGILDEKLERAIRIKLGKVEDDEVSLRKSFTVTEDYFPDARILHAAPLAALIGVFRVAEADEHFFDQIEGLDPRSRAGDNDLFVMWVNNHAEQIARAAREELSQPFEPALLQLPAVPAPGAAVGLTGLPPRLIQRVFLDRRASLAEGDGNATIKADAAQRVFEVSCRPITWAILDSGIATRHPAFLDHDSRNTRGRPADVPVTRIRATYDFTLIEQIRSFDLIEHAAESPEREAAIRKLATALEQLPGEPAVPGFLDHATRTLTLIAEQLEHPVPPDWGLIETLIRRNENDDGVHLCSDHGTHVAGILAADWQSTRPAPDGRPQTLLRGVCPDINLYDLRVIHPGSRQSTEFALLAALEFVQFLNSRSAGGEMVVHGVNISLSIPHDVRNYGCGATPVCVACDRLVNSGVVVVAAAGNRGWNEQETGFGNFVFSSITDPGNAQEVITVGATHRAKPHTYGVSYFSSRGPTGDGRLKPDLVAPGESIRGPIRGDADDELDGTSMAAPFVSGAAAMLLARHPELIGKPARVKQILCSTATDLGRERYFQGHGLVDVLRALQSV